MGTYVLTTLQAIAHAYEHPFRRSFYHAGTLFNISEVILEKFYSK